MSDVLQLSDASVWTAVETSGTRTELTGASAPTIESEPDWHSEPDGGSTQSKRRRAPTVSVDREAGAPALGGDAVSAVPHEARSPDLSDARIAWAAPSARSRFPRCDTRDDSALLSRPPPPNSWPPESPAASVSSTPTSTHPLSMTATASRTTSVWSMR